MITKAPNYWRNKIAAWMNESPIKIFDIENRDKIAAEIANVVMNDLDNNSSSDLIKISDNIASGMTRAILPADFEEIKKIKLNHPLVKNKSLEFSTPDVTLNSLVEEIKRLLNEDISKISIDDEEKRAKEIFNYLFFAFNKRLRNSKETEISKVGALWDILPADSRMPDHALWHHLGLTSAIYSSLEQNEEKSSKENLSMVVYSITPVQDFIGKARKLRDYWTGSVLLSYLAFVGITKVIEELGPDHILYPSLHNQALMEQWLFSKYDYMENFLSENDRILNKLHEDSKSIASFPNKFVFICNKKHVKDICEEIENKIKTEWKNVSDVVKDYLRKISKTEKSTKYDELWSKSVTKYWKCSWASSNFATINNEKQIEKLLPKVKWENELSAMKKFEEFRTKDNTTNYDVSNLYGTTHSLVQGLLAAGKTKPTFDTVKNSQDGEKCPLCGEHEVLHNFDYSGTTSASEYNQKVTSFWDGIRKNANNGTDDFKQVGEKERLCAICTLKRFLPVALKQNKEKNILLYHTLAEPYDKNNFPSTTEMSAWEFLQTQPQEKRAEIVNKLHNEELEADDSVLEGAKGFETKYYAFLLMDGDKMGDLINGETTEATWKNVLNINNNVNTPFADSNFVKQRRTINPALHSMISDSLNNFARYGVQPAIQEAGGRLVYAGGDDVCAILPLSTAFVVADKIRQAYQLSYGQVTEKGSVALLCGEQEGVTEKTTPSSNMSKIVMHLGHSDNQEETKISLSGAIIIAHHKTPLKEIITQAHAVLDGVAKEKSGRNSLAIRLDKRSGGSRDMWFKWEDKNIFSQKELTIRESFENIVKMANGKELSTSLLYKIESLRASLEPLANDIKSNKELIIKLLEYEISHSGYKNDAHNRAIDLAGLCIKRNKKFDEDKDWYNPEAAIIASFLAKSGMKVEAEKNE